MQPLLARTLYYTGITRLGVSRAGPLLGTVPLIAIAVAVVFLGERPGVSVYLGTTLIVASVWLVFARRSGERDRRVIDLIYPFGAAFFSASALMSMGSQLLTFVALSRGEVSVIIPIVNVIPLFAVLLSALFLKELEKVTPKVILGAALMVSGVLIISNR